MPCPAVVTVLALTFWFCSRVNNRPLCLHCFSLRYNDHISVQNYNTLPSTARPLGDDSGCCSCLLSGAKLSAVLILLAPSGLLARPAGGIAAILRFPSIFLLCWFPCALNPMPASSLLCSFVLSEVTATSAVRPGRENLKFCFPFFFFLRQEILYSSSPSTTLIKPCCGPGPGKGGGVVFPALRECCPPLLAQPW